MKNMGVRCRHYDQSSLDVCQRYNRTRLDIYLPMSLSVSCGKMTSLILLHLNDPSNDSLWQYCRVVPSRFYQLMLERRCQSLG
jgi:hypothetical protein